MKFGSWDSNKKFELKQGASVGRLGEPYSPPFDQHPGFLSQYSKDNIYQSYQQSK